MAEAEAFSSVAESEPKKELSPEELRQKRKEYVCLSRCASSSWLYDLTALSSHNTARRMEAKMKEATRKRIEKEARVRFG